MQKTGRGFFLIDHLSFKRKHTFFINNLSLAHEVNKQKQTPSLEHKRCAVGHENNDFNGFNVKVFLDSKDYVKYLHLVCLTSLNV